MTIPGVIFWIVALVALGGSWPLPVYLFACAGVFGMLAVLPPDLTSGVSILGQSVATIVLAFWITRRRGGGRELVEAALNPRALGILTLFVFVACISALVLPHVFAGRVNVIPFRADYAGVAPLQPTKANLTQPLYIVLSLISACVFSVVFRDGNLRQHGLSANRWAGGLLIATGLADIATVGSDLLAPFRNATYMLHSTDAILSTRRVVGLMPEASSFGGACVALAAFLYFSRPGVAPRRGVDFAIIVLVLGMVAMACASLSSTAFFGLSLVVTLAALNWGRRLLFRRRALLKQLAYADFIIVSILGLACIVLLIANPDVVQIAYNFVDELVFKKTNSQSYIERSYSNEVGLRLFAQTSGLGVGVGSHSASNWAIAVLCNTGVLGAFLMAAFLIQCALRRPQEMDIRSLELMTGLKLALAVNIGMALLSSTTADFGVLNGMIFGAMAGLSYPDRALRE